MQQHMGTLQLMAWTFITQTKWTRYTSTNVGGRIAEIVFYGEAVYDGSDMERADILVHIIADDRFERRKEKSIPNAATQGSGEGLRRTEKIMNRISELHEAKFNYLTKMFLKPEIRQKIEAVKM
ncbi:hypothetical protein niasHT_031656 [Heterodera trifolii]|uniref:Uncharacterized protein n=1 Tax=Heterodera trifolii TaxID=157864 RepID=A0ABD2J4E3_9BILA